MIPLPLWIRAGDLDGVTVIGSGDVRTSAGFQSTQKITGRQVSESGRPTVRRSRLYPWAPSQGREYEQERDQAPSFHGYLLLNQVFLGLGIGKFNGGRCEAGKTPRGSNRYGPPQKPHRFYPHFFDLWNLCTGILCAVCELYSSLVSHTATKNAAAEQNLGPLRGAPGCRKEFFRWQCCVQPTSSTPRTWESEPCSRRIIPFAAPCARLPNATA